MFHLLTIFTIICIIIYFFINYWTIDLIYVKSTRDNNYYLVRNLPDKIEAANRLSYIKDLLIILIERLIIAYPNNEQIKLMKNRFHPNNIQESSQFSKHTSYSIDKGYKLVFCLRSKGTNQELIPMNTIIFVALHEISHVYSISEGHQKEFWDAFRFMLSHAIKWKIYEYVNYKSSNTSYCGTYITDTPLNENDIDRYVTYNKENNDFADLQFPQYISTES